MPAFRFELAFRSSENTPHFLKLLFLLLFIAIVIAMIIAMIIIIIGVVVVIIMTMTITATTKKKRLTENSPTFELARKNAVDYVSARD